MNAEVTEFAKTIMDLCTDRDSGVCVQALLLAAVAIADVLNMPTQVLHDSIDAAFEAERGQSAEVH